MKPVIDIILTAFTIIGMLFALICAFFVILVLGFFISGFQRERQKAREKQQVTQSLAQIRLEVDETFKQDVMAELDKIFQEHRPGGDTGPQVPIVG